MRALIVDVLLVSTVLCELICVVGVLASGTVYDRLHYSGALRQPHPYTAPVWNALFVALALFALNNVLSHAIARAARARGV
jgi:multisubunit Na+/H+ antiporter MnhG subunit